MRPARRCGCRAGSASSGGSPLQLGPGAQFVLEYVLLVGFALLHDDELAVVDVAEVLKVFDGPVVPARV